MADSEAQIYELTRNPRPWASAFFSGTFLLAAGGELTENDGLVAAVAFGIIGILFAANTWHLFRRAPTSVVVGDDGLLFTTQAGDRLVAWGDLVAVRVNHGKYGGGISWRLARRPHVWTAATFGDQHRLLVEVERRAPRARVSP